MGDSLPKVISAWITVISGIVALIISINTCNKANDTADKQSQTSIAVAALQDTVSKISQKLAESLIFYDLKNGDAVQGLQRVHGKIGTNIPVGNKVYALIQKGNIYNVMRTPIVVLADGTFDYQYVIGFTGDMSLCIALCNNESCEAFEKMNFQLSQLLPGMILLKCVDVHKG